MKLKLIIRKIIYTNLGIYLRNFFNYLPVAMYLGDIKGSVSVSDAFCWRTDLNYETTFKYSDILSLFFKFDDSEVEIFFYDKNNKFIKKLLIKKIELSNELKVNKKLLDNLEDYGVFYIFHKTDKKMINNSIISNRCYLGFSFNKSLNSYVHGNHLAIYKDLSGVNKKRDIVKTSGILNQKYRIQNYFNNFSKAELFFSNATSKKITFYVNNEKYILKKGFSKIVDISQHKEVEIKSNCLFLRPLVFNYKNTFVDVYHA